MTAPNRQDESGWHLKVFGEAGNDITPRFLELTAEAKDGNSSSVTAEARSFVYLLIPGLFTENYPVRAYGSVCLFFFGFGR